MRKLQILLVFFILLNAFTFVLQLKKGLSKNEPEPESTQQAAPDLVGQSFALSYYPIDPDEPGVVGVAARFNSHNYRLTFSDSTYIQRSNRYLTEHPYRIAGDSIYLGKHPYHMDGLILRDSLFIVELTPLR